MSDTNQHSHPEFVQIGPAVLCLYDEVNDHLVRVGKVDDIVLSKEVESQELTEMIRGVETEIDSRPVKETYKLKGMFRETLDPNTQRLFMKNCTTPAVTGCSIETVTERLPMYDGPQKILTYNSGFYGTGALPAAVSAVAGVFGVGGTIPNGTYVFVVTALYGVTEGTHVESVGQAVVLGENVTLTITPPAGCDPDSYNIYVYDTAAAETIANATLIANVTETAVFFTSWVRGALYVANTGSFTVTDSTGGTTYLPGTDYTIDETHAMLCVVSTGAIPDGEVLIVTYSYYKNAWVNMSIGPPDRLPKYVHPVIVSFKDDDSINPVGRGLEVHLYRVVANSAWEWELSKMEFNTGFAFEWKVLSDPRKLRHGDVFTYHRQLATYDLVDWAALTEFANAADCAPP